MTFKEAWDNAKDLEFIRFEIKAEKFHKPYYGEKLPRKLKKKRNKKLNKFKGLYCAGIDEYENILFTNPVKILPPK